MVTLFILLFILIYILNLNVGLLLEWLNISNIKKYLNAPPKIFVNLIDPNKYKESISYTIDKTRVNVAVTILDAVILLAVIYLGVLNWLDLIIRGLGLSEIHTGMLFFMALILISTIKSIPVSLYLTFMIEEKYGFNKQTFKLWIADFFKGLLISVIVSAIVGYGLLCFMLYAGTLWWLWAWTFMFLIGLVMMKLFPVLIAPLFNKFEELPDGELRRGIEELSEKTGFKIKNIFRVDAKKRSTHSNAYFTGLGKSKRIVLYDTLIESMTAREILGILAHEIGHYKYKHIIKGVLITQVVSFIFFYILSVLIKEPVVYKMFLIENQSMYIGILLIGLIWSVISFWITPFFTWLSRKNEFESDEYAFNQLNDYELFKSIFTKLSIENLSNLTPHPLYSKFYYSHPPVIERIAKIKSLSQKLQLGLS